MACLQRMVWVVAAGLATTLANAQGDRARLDAEQQRWLQLHPAVRFAPEKDYGPFVFQAADGQVQGLSIDMLRLVQRHTGLAVQTLAAEPLQPLLDKLKAGQADLLSSLRPTPERSQFLDFSVPYVRVPALVFARGGRASGGDALAGLAGRRVAVGAGYAVESVVRAAHPEVAWQSVPDDVQALTGVAEGRFDAAVVDAASAPFVMRQRGLRGIVSVGEVGFDYELSFAVRRDWPQLRGIIDSGIHALSAAERQEVLDRWLSPLEPAAPEGHAPGATRLGWWLLAVAALAAGLLSVRRAVRGRA